MTPGLVYKDLGEGKNDHKLKRSSNVIKASFYNNSIHFGNLNVEGELLACILIINPNDCQL